ADDDGDDDLSEDDADDEDEEESSDSEEEEDEHLASTVPAPALHRTPPLLPIPLPTSSFPLPLLLPTEDRLIGRLRRDKQYFHTLSTTYAQEVAHSHDYCTQIMENCQAQEVHTNTLVTRIEALQRDVSTLQRQQINDEDRLMRNI
nr:hypothetical protein [Tanacetum cinerariifolium]